MGDRANIKLVFSNGSDLYLYTHSSGYEWPEELRKALIAGKGRWGDEPYLARIIVSNVFSDIHGWETGGGISPYETDNEHPIIECDLVDDHVAIDGKSWTFSEYVAQEEATYP